MTAIDYSIRRRVATLEEFAQGFVHAGLLDVPALEDADVDIANRVCGLTTLPSVDDFNALGHKYAVAPPVTVPPFLHVFTSHGAYVKTGPADAIVFGWIITLDQSGLVDPSSGGSIVNPGIFSGEVGNATSWAALPSYSDFQNWVTSLCYPVLFAANYTGLSTLQPGGPAEPCQVQDIRIKLHPAD
jgi:hypothetical protein